MSTRRSGAAGRRQAAPSYRITMVNTAAVPRGAALESLPWLLGLAAAVLLMLATVAFPWWQALVGHAVADYHYWQGKQAYRASEPQIVVQRHWQAAVAADPGYRRVRLDLARSYLDAEWYGGAIAECEAVLAQRHTPAEASLAYTYMGYAHTMRGEAERGLAELETAVEHDPQNALAQSLLERLERRGQLPKLEPAAF